MVTKSPNEGRGAELRDLVRMHDRFHHSQVTLNEG
jgi:hypothetical protein